MVSGALFVATVVLNLIFMVSGEFTTPEFFGGFIIRYPCWWRWYIKQMKGYYPEAVYNYDSFQYKESLYKWDEQAIFATPIESASFAQTHPNTTTKMTNDWDDCKTFYGAIDCAAFIDPRILENEEIRKTILINKRWNQGGYSPGISVWKGSPGKGKRARSLIHGVLNNTDLLQDVLMHCITDWKVPSTQPLGGAPNSWLSNCEVVFFRTFIDEKYIIGHTMFDDPTNAINVHEIEWTQVGNLTDGQNEILYWLLNTVHLPLYADFFMINGFQNLQNVKQKMLTESVYELWVAMYREIERMTRKGTLRYKHKDNKLIQAAIRTI